MDSMRLEMRLGSALGSSTVVKGTVAGEVLAAVLDPATLTVVQTAVASRVARQLGLAAEGAAGTPGIRLSSKTEVRVAGGKHNLGNLGRLWADRATNHLTHILISKDRAFYVLDVAHVATFDAQHIILTENVRDLQSIPVYRDDAAIGGDVGAAIETTLLDPRSRRSIHARVEDGQVDLSGTLYSEEEFNALFSAIKRTPGVRGVRSDVVIEVELADAVMSAIDQLRAKGDIAATDIIQVLSEHQILYLQGQVSTPKVKAAAERAALSVAGVRLVVNNLSTITPEKTERADPASPETHLR
ncbi:MAG: BON domain-containing protein [Ktedonobacterales bacterium]|nr:BON domain-containing protein [Ktedonobacterales bacterium]